MLEAETNLIHKLRRGEENTDFYSALIRKAKLLYIKEMMQREEPTTSTYSGVIVDEAEARALGVGTRSAAASAGSGRAEVPPSRIPQTESAARLSGIRTPVSLEEAFARVQFRSKYSILHPRRMPGIST